MDADLGDLMSVGILAIVIAGSTLMLLVRFDLVPGGRSGAVAGSGGRWIVAAGLGLGIIAFAMKLTIVAVVSHFPSQMVAPLIEDVGKARFDLAETGTSPERISRIVWQALPDQAPAPAGNPTTPARVALGERLFFDPALSRNGAFSCASCHDPLLAGADGRAGSVGITATAGRRNAPTVWNTAFQAVLFWDGRAASLEDQAKGPMVNPDEMGMPSLEAVERAVRADPAYRDAFADAFGATTPITIDRIAEAIAAYERTLITPDTAYDRFVRGDGDALSPAQRRGMALFQSVGCVTCHTGPNFSGASLFGTGSPYRLFPANASPYDQRYRLIDDKGRAGPGAERGVWRIPSLRNVALTGPYFHNGAVDDLAEAVRVMATVQLNAVLTDDPRLGRMAEWSPEAGTLAVYGRRVLSGADIDDIVAFLHALSSPSLAARKASIGR